MTNGVSVVSVCQKNEMKKNSMFVWRSFVAHTHTLIFCHEFGTWSFLLMSHLRKPISTSLNKFDFFFRIFSASQKTCVYFQWWWQCECVRLKLNQFEFWENLLNFISKINFIKEFFCLDKKKTSMLSKLWLRIFLSWKKDF